MKKVLVLTLGAGLASAVASSAVCASYLNYVGVYGSATDTKPSNNGLSIGEIQTNVPPTAPHVQPFYPYDRAVFLAPQFNWDYNLGVSFHFPCTDTRAFAEYDYFNDNDSRTVSGLAKYPTYPLPGSTREGNVARNSPIFDTTDANVMETSHEWRVGLKHFVHFGPRFLVDFAAFFEYDRINISLHESTELEYSNVVTTLRIPNTLTNSYYESNSKLTAWGPGAGLKLIGTPMACCPTFTIFGGLWTTLFYAKNNYSDYLYEETVRTPTGLPVPALTGLVYAHTPEFSQSILTKIDINFGVDYHRMLCMVGSRFESGISVGVRYMNIFNAFKNGNVSPQTVEDTSTTAANQVFFPVIGIPNDWGRVGPYIQFRVGGCDA